jgi:hypothetical protein
MKTMHRLIVSSSTYRMASTPDATNLRLDPDNVYLWRSPSRRMEAEVIRDNLLYVAGDLDSTRGGPDIDHKLGLTSKRRSIYLRQAAEKEVEFLKIFDGPAVTECYQRRPSVMPQQALALANSELALHQARSLAAKLASKTDLDEADFVRQAFQCVLARTPTEQELRVCEDFLRSPQPDQESSARLAGQRRRENLILVLLNHNDFVTIR